jgi:hypothetical protein
MALSFSGIVDVSLFDSNADMSFLTANSLIPSLNHFSDWPLVNAAVGGVGNSIEKLFSYVFGITVETSSSNPSIFSVNTGSAGTVGEANYIDGQCVLALPTSGTSGGKFSIYVVTQPMQPGVYTNQTFNSYTFVPEVINGTGTIVGGEMLNNNTLTKGCYNYEPCFVGFQAPGTGADDTFIPAPFYVDIGGQVGPSPQIEFLGLNTTVNFASTYVTARLPPPPPFSLELPPDNSALGKPNSGSPGIFNLQWLSLTSAYTYNQVEIDDTGLPGGLSDLFNNTNPSSWSNGFLSIVETLGAGPTGQRFELIFVDAPCTQWWLVRLNPMDAASGAAVTSEVTEGWSATVDPNGVLWFNPGTDATKVKMFFSFSPLEFFFPWVTPQSLNPIVLPCYSTCNPVNTIQQDT